MQPKHKLSLRWQIPKQNIVLVPAFVGLGAPYWNADCRGAVFGLTRASGAAELTKASLESVGYQTRDLLEAMSVDWTSKSIMPTLRVDGGMSKNDWAMQFLSDIIDAPVDRSNNSETTALGAAWLAGMNIGLYPDQEKFGDLWALEKQFMPTMKSDERNMKYDTWKKAVQATLSF